VIECISALCVLGLVILSLLIMTNAISLEEAIRAFGQAFALIIIVLWAICVLKGLMAVAVSVLKSLAVWIAILAFVIVGVAVLVRIIFKLWKPLQKNSVKREDNYE
jgi:hypothetical protein